MSAGLDVMRHATTTSTLPIQLPPWLLPDSPGGGAPGTVASPVGTSRADASRCMVDLLDAADDDLLTLTSEAPAAAAADDDLISLPSGAPASAAAPTEAAPHGAEETRGRSPSCGSMLPASVEADLLAGALAGGEPVGAGPADVPAPFSMIAPFSRSTPLPRRRLSSCKGNEKRQAGCRDADNTLSCSVDSSRAQSAASFSTPFGTRWRATS